LLEKDGRTLRFKKKTEDRRLAAAAVSLVFFCLLVFCFLLRTPLFQYFTSSSGCQQIRMIAAPYLKETTPPDTLRGDHGFHLTLIFPNATTP
jgi:hypothetical protein